MIFGYVDSNGYCCFTHTQSQGGVSYIAQVLKRNRTLKVLNISENRLDMTGLLAVAEALVRSLPAFCQNDSTNLCPEIQLLVGDAGSQQEPLLWS